MARPFWRLTRGGETLAYLRPDDKLRFPDLDGHFTSEAAFEPTPAYEPVRRLFEREVEIAGDEGEVEQAIVDPRNRTAGRTPLLGVWIAVVSGVCE